MTLVYKNSVDYKTVRWKNNILSMVLTLCIDLARMTTSWQNGEFSTNLYVASTYTSSSSSSSAISPWCVKRKDLLLSSSLPNEVLKKFSSLCLRMRTLSSFSSSLSSRSSIEISGCGDEEARPSILRNLPQTLLYGILLVISTGALLEKIIHAINVYLPNLNCIYICVFL